MPSSAARIWPWVKILGGAAIVAVLLWRLGAGAFLDGVRVIDAWALLVAFGIGLLTTVFSAWRWCLVARGLGIRLPMTDAIADYYRALFLNAALPGGVLGDVHRAVRHGKDVGDVGRGVRAVVLERSAGQVTLIAVGVGVLIVLPSPVGARLREVVAGASMTPVIALAAVVAAVIVAAVIVATAAAVGFLSRSRLAGAARTVATDLRSGLFTRRTGPGILLASAVVLAGHLATFMVAARAAGSSVPLTRLVPLMLLALLAMTLPLNIGGWGPREGAAAWAFGAAGLSAAQGVTIAVAYGLFAFVASLPGAAVLLVRWHARLRRA
jgi:uncharacterized membrane protein YbhN (UPF0104 family)